MNEFLSYIKYICTLALSECHKIICLTIKNMHIGCINFPKKFGLEILIVARALAQTS